jgi:hypothetical protein
MTVGEAWGHFQANELRDADVDRSPTTILNYLTCFKVQIIPRWGSVKLIDVKATAVKKWLRGLDLAPASKEKLRNQLSSLFRHCIRHELEGEDVKVVQELLRHASPKITQDLYQQGHTVAKRSALDRMSGIFVVPAAKASERGE